MTTELNLTNNLYFEPQITLASHFSRETINELLNSFKKQ